MNKLFICNKVGIGDACHRCEHSEPHKPILINPQWDTDTSCQKTDDCSLYIDNEYNKEIKVKCKIIK